MSRYVLLISGIFFGLLAGGCKTARKNYSYGKQVVTPASSQNTDPVANGMAQFFANLYAKNKGDIKKTIAELDASGPEGEAIMVLRDSHLVDY